MSLKQQMGRVKRIWYLSPMRAAKVQASLRTRAVSPEHSLLAHTSSESRGTFRQKARSLAPLNGWACAVEICHDGMLDDTNSFDGTQIICKHWYLQNTISLKLQLCWVKVSVVVTIQDKSCLPDFLSFYTGTFYCVCVSSNIAMKHTRSSTSVDECTACIHVECRHDDSFLFNVMVFCYVKER